MSELEDWMLRIRPRRDIRNRNTKYKIAVNKMKKSIEEGATTINEIAKKAGIAYETARRHAKKEGIKLPNDKSEEFIGDDNNQTVAEKIKRDVEEGVPTISEISRRAGVGFYTVKRHAKKEGIILPEHKRGVSIFNKIVDEEEVCKNIKDSLDRKVRSLERLVKEHNFNTVHGFREFCVRNYIDLPEDLEPYRTRPDIDSLIDKGADIRTMGKKAGISYQAVLDYINRSGQYKNWTKNSEKAKLIGLRWGGKYAQLSIFKQTKELLISVAKERAKQLSWGEDWAFQKAVVAYTSSRCKYNSFSFERLYLLFRDYQKNIEEGNKVCLKEYGRNHEMDAMSVRRVFNIAGIEPMFGKIEMTLKKRGIKKLAVERGFQTRFSGLDIAYFLDLPEYIPDLRYVRLGGRGKSKKRVIINFSGGRILSYRDASLIYEAQDAGFKQKEIIELIGKGEGVVDYALEKRIEIEPQIVNGLRILYADKNIELPYLTREMRERELS